MLALFAGGRGLLIVGGGLHLGPAAARQLGQEPDGQDRCVAAGAHADDGGVEHQRQGQPPPPLHAGHPPEAKVVLLLQDRDHGRDAGVQVPRVVAVHTEVRQEDLPDGVVESVLEEQRGPVPHPRGVEAGQQPRQDLLVQADEVQRDEEDAFDEADDHLKHRRHQPKIHQIHIRPVVVQAGVLQLVPVEQRPLSDLNDDGADTDDDDQLDDGARERVPHPDHDVGVGDD
mmetsp:Transcript_3419/g.6534  ORF Transcript_3419/g.6534 Transcript_3419/m.6534 type:complete len:229 (+) Transcript_3419:1361-2047(+)